MKCKSVRHHLLASAKPARPPGAVADHLARCSLCRAWHLRLVRLEQLVPELPVPPSDAKAVFLRDVLPAEPLSSSSKVEVEWQRHERALRKVAITFAMAAGLMFFALIWYAWQQQHVAQLTDLGPAPRTMTPLEHVIDQYDRGALTAADPRDRFQRLAAVAKRLHTETTERVRNGTIDEVTALTRKFEVVVRDGILPQARFVPVESRSEILAPVADELQRAESAANRLATQRADVAEPLRNMATAAQRGNRQLLELVRG